jgi:DUF2971 family protein
MPTLDELLAGPKATGRTLYHYTTQQGLLGITKSRKLWTTSIIHLNDAAEFNYAGSLLYQKLAMMLGHSTEEIQRRFYLYLLNSLHKARMVTLFVGSFSEDGDSLSQWRGYSHGGFGFNIGFKDTYIESLARQQSYRLVKCFYDPAQHNEIISNLISSANPTAIDFEAVAEAFFEKLVRVAPILKHPSFEAEQEWRIVSEMLFAITSNNVEFRPGKSMLIPYKDFTIEDKDGFIQAEDLCTGPGPHPDLSRFSLIQLSANKGFKKPIQLRTSQIPYRSW